MTFGLRFNRFAQMAFFSTVVMAIHGFCEGVAFAGGVVINTPAGLEGTDKFRIIFVTPGTIQSSSPDISTYNDFVNAQAAGATYNGVAIHWSAIVSTDAVDARDNIGQTNSGVYMADGTKVATSANGAPGGLWRGDPILAQPVQDLSGNTYSGPVWTGTSGVGTEYASMPVPDNSSTHVLVTWGMGNSTNVTVRGVNYVNRVQIGQLGGSGYTWISSGPVTLNTNAYQVYGISDVLTVVPEPSTFLISALGVFVIGLSQTLRNRNKIPSIES